MSNYGVITHVAMRMRILRRSLLSFTNCV